MFIKDKGAIRTCKEGNRLPQSASLRISCLLISGGFDHWEPSALQQWEERGLHVSSSVSCQLLISSSQSGSVCHHQLPTWFLPCGPSPVVLRLAVVHPEGLNTPAGSMATPAHILLWIPVYYTFLSCKDNDWESVRSSLGKGSLSRWKCMCKCAVVGGSMASCKSVCLGHQSQQTWQWQEIHIVLDHRKLRGSPWGFRLMIMAILKDMSQHVA